MRFIPLVVKDLITIRTARKNPKIAEMNISPYGPTKALFGQNALELTHRNWQLLCRTCHRGCKTKQQYEPEEPSSFHADHSTIGDCVPHDKLLLAWRPSKRPNPFPHSPTSVPKRSLSSATWPATMTAHGFSHARPFTKLSSKSRCWPSSAK